MSADVKILIEGFTNAGEGSGKEGEKTQATITLVRDGDLVMVVDPGILENQQILIDALEKENLTINDVNIVCITHSHLDHYRNIGMFPNAKTLEYFGLWDKNTVEEWSENFSPNIQIMHTPGHDYTGITLFVKTGPECKYPGIVAICGDVFWKENFPEMPEEDAYSSHPEKLKESREMVSKKADWIIPGHAGIYKNNLDLVASEVISSKVVQQKIIVKCKKCGREMSQKDKCQCRPFLCYRCCNCDTDCNLCSCSHKIFRK